MKFWANGHKKSKTLAAPSTAHGANIYATDNQFFIMLLGALIVHLAVLFIYSVIPREETLIVPVRVLNLKLGAAGLSDVTIDPREVSVPTAKAAESLSHTPVPAKKILPTPPPKKKTDAKPAASKKTTYTAPAKKMPKKIVVPEEAPNNPLNVTKKQRNASNPYAINQPPTQYVRAPFVQEAQAKPVAQGNNNPGANTQADQVHARYEQLLSGWLMKYKFNPVEAEEHNLKGRGVVLIRINRRGEVLHYSLAKKTGHDVLDRAILTMVKRAGKVPPVPLNYPPGRQLEFLITVSYK